MKETLIVLGICSLFILGVVCTFGAMEFRPQLLAAWRRVRRLAVLPPLFTPGPGSHRSPARAVWGSARRMPSGVESLAAAGAVPDAEAVRPSRPASGACRLLTTGELAALHPAAHRTVNGRLLGTQPRITIATELEQQRARRAAAACAAPSVELLKQVRDALQRLPVYGEAPQLDVDEAQRLAGGTLP